MYSELHQVFRFDDFGIRVELSYSNSVETKIVECHT
jgi:hypothetical protein